jgi:hypothetical protein
LRVHGPAPLHRFSYAPVREASRAVEWTLNARQEPLPFINHAGE